MNLYDYSDITIGSLCTYKFLVKSGIIKDGKCNSEFFDINYREDLTYESESVIKFDDEDTTDIYELVKPAGTLNGAMLVSNFELEISKRNVDGHSSIDKFGVNTLITTGTDPEDIWEGGGVYNYDDNGTAPIVSIASNNAGDNQEISVLGLDIDGNEVEQTVTLNGTARVALTTALWRVFRLENEGTTDIAGTVFVYTGTGTVPSIGDAEVRAIIDNGNNQTLMALYTIPLGKVGFLYRGEVGMQYSGTPGAGSNYAKCYYKSRRVGKVFKVKKSISLINTASSIFQDKRSFPDIIPALTDIKIVAEEVSEDMGIWATFDILLVDEDQFSQAYLDAIGQPSEMPS